MEKEISTFQIIDSVRERVHKSCMSENNRYGPQLWEEHILVVVNNADKLAHTLNADRDVVVLAAYLHDLSNIENYYLEQVHHIESANLAREFLFNLGLPISTIDSVCTCILEHRGRALVEKRSTIESDIVASADAMTHIQKFISLLLSFRERIDGREETLDYIQNKLKRTYKKLMPEAIDLVKNELDAIELLTGWKIRS